MYNLKDLYFHYSSIVIMKNVKNLTIAIVVVVIAIAGIFAYKSKWMSSTQSNTEQADGLFPGIIKVGHLIALDMAPLFVAKEEGFFEDEGLDVELAFFSNPGDNNAALAGGSLQFHINPFTLPYFGENSGVPMRIISTAGGLEIMQVVIQGQYDVESMKQLAEWVNDNPDEKLKVGTLRGDTLDMILYKSFADVGLTYDDFEMVWFNDLLAMVETFRTKEIAILSHIKPYTTDLIVNYDAEVLTDNDTVWGKGTPNTTIVVLEDFLEQYPETVRRYLRATYKGFNLIVNDPERAVALLSNGNYFKIDEDVLLYAFKNQPKEVLLHPNVDGMTIAIEDMIKQNYIKRPKQSIVKTEILDEVVREFQ